MRRVTMCARCSVAFIIAAVFYVALMLTPGTAIAATCAELSGSCGLADPDTHMSVSGASDCPSTCFKPINSVETGEQIPVSGTPQSAGALQLVSCVKDGNCTIDDIVNQGVNFARFIMGLSGAVFFVVFIYGGAMYLLSFGEKTMVQKGESAIKGAAIGIILVVGAWTIVSLLVSSIEADTGGGGAPADACVAKGPGYSCMTLSGKTTAEAQADGQKQGLSCTPGLCPEPANVLCCKKQ